MLADLVQRDFRNHERYVDDDVRRAGPGVYV
jgi:hypothetical protein